MFRKYPLMIKKPNTSVNKQIIYCKLTTKFEKDIEPPEYYLIVQLRVQANQFSVCTQLMSYKI